ncbi:10091_t:CDS:2, partial [Ambispora gerdemannii]
MVVKISQKEQQKLSGLKELDIQQCSFCQRTNLLNLGVARNILDCHLYQELPRVRPIKVVKPNRSYDKCACYCCGEELAGAMCGEEVYWGAFTQQKEDLAE